MNPSAPIGKIIKVAKAHPVLTVTALGVVAVLVAIRIRSSSGSGFDTTGTGADGSGGGGGGSVPAETVPGAPSNVPVTPSTPSVVLSSPIMSVPEMPAVSWVPSETSSNVPVYIPPSPSVSLPSQNTALSSLAQVSGTAVYNPAPGGTLKVTPVPSAPIGSNVVVYNQAGGGAQKNSVSIGKAPVPVVQPKNSVSIGKVPVTSVSIGAPSAPVKSAVYQPATGGAAKKPAVSGGVKVTAK